MSPFKHNIRKLVRIPCATPEQAEAINLAIATNHTAHMNMRWSDAAKKTAEWAEAEMEKFTYAPFRSDAMIPIEEQIRVRASSIRVTYTDNPFKLNEADMMEAAANEIERLRSALSAKLMSATCSCG